MKETYEPGTYIIRIRGHLGEHWAARLAGRFESMTITLTETGETHLTVQLPDQAALHGILRTVRDSGLELLFVNRVDTQ